MRCRLPRLSNVPVLDDRLPTPCLQTSATNSTIPSLSLTLLSRSGPFSVPRVQDTLIAVIGYTVPRLLC
jgi:hypothetical protein